MSHSPDACDGSGTERSEDLQSTPTVPQKDGPWSDEEHALFMQGLEQYGWGKWKEISAHFIPSRTRVQVATHAHKFLARTRRDKKKNSTIKLPTTYKGRPLPDPPPSQKTEKHSASTSDKEEKESSSTSPLCDPPTSPKTVPSDSGHNETLPMQELPKENYFSVFSPITPVVPEPPTSTTHELNLEILEIPESLFSIEHENFESLLFPPLKMADHSSPVPSQPPAQENTSRPEKSPVADSSPTGDPTKRRERETESTDEDARPSKTPRASEHPPVTTDHQPFRPPPPPIHSNSSKQTRAAHHPLDSAAQRLLKENSTFSDWPEHQDPATDFRWAD